MESSALEKLIGNSWKSADSVLFDNEYTPTPVTEALPPIFKVIEGDRSEPLKEGEFGFELQIVSADPADGITLPSDTVVSNAADGTVVFDNITFTKAGTYAVSVKEIPMTEI